jgi:hypothetical protein
MPAREAGEEAAVNPAHDVTSVAEFASTGYVLDGSVAPEK